MKIISDKSINYPFAAGVWIALSLIFYLIFLSVGLDGKFWTALCFIAGGLFAFGDRTYVPILSEGLLLFNGEEVKDGNHSVWLSPGMYFTFFIFKVSNKEALSKERDKIIVEPFTFNDSTGKKLVGSINAIWVVGESDEDKDNFKLMKASNMEEDLKTYLKAKFISTFSTKRYENEIRGQENLHFRSDDLKVYGVIFKELHSLVLSANQDQDDINAQFDRLFEHKKAGYGNGYRFTHEELKELREETLVQLGKIKKISTNSPLLGRYNVD